MIHVFGLGECGSRIVLDLFGQLYPNATIDDTPPTSAFRRCIDTICNVSAAVTRAGRESDLTASFQLGGINISLKPHVFIGDLNKGNTNYRRYLAAQRIQELSRSAGAELDRDKCRSKLQEEGLLDERIQFDKLYDLVTTKHGTEQFITLLRFNADAGAQSEDPTFDMSTGMSGEGAGGNQIYSELAAEKYQIHNRLQAMEGSKSILVGIFSIGGGTGAGSASHIFRKLAQSGYAYTLAIAIMPTWDDSEQKARAGRYIAKYLRTDAPKRSRSLLLISNQAASIAMRSIQDRKGVDESSSLAAVNEFALNCLKAILLLRATTLRTIEGKQLDFMDLSTWVKGTIAMGYACQRIGMNEEVDLWPHLVRAIVPLHVGEDPQTHPDSQGLFLEGMSVCVSDNEDPISAERDVLCVRNSLLSSAAALAASSLITDVEGMHIELKAVGDKWTLYGTMKRCTFLIFVPNTAKITNLPSVKDRLRQFFQILTGNSSFDLSFNVYSVDGLSQIEVVAFPQECLINEAVGHVADFVAKGFANEADISQIAAVNEFISEAWMQIQKVFARQLTGISDDTDEANAVLSRISEKLQKHEQIFEEREELYVRVKATAAEAEALRFTSADLLPVVQQFRMLARTLPKFNTKPPEFRRG